MTKEEVQQRVLLKSGEFINMDDFIWDEKHKIFSTKLNNLVLDFRDLEYIVFDFGHACIIVSGDHCNFNAGSNCTIISGNNCYFNISCNCTIVSGNYCNFNNADDSVIISGDNGDFYNVNRSIIKNGKCCTF